MKALLLAAGLGTRLRPITNTIPKCLVPIEGKPLLEYWLENLTNAGINEFLINTSYLSEQVEAFVNRCEYKDNITLIHEDKLLNTGGTLLANKDFFSSDEPFMLVHADNLCLCDFSAFIDSHKKRPNNCDITMMLFHTDNPKSCGIVELDTKNVVQNFYEKVDNPPSNLANGAVYICENSIFKALEEVGKKDVDFSLDIIPRYLGKINTFVNNIYHRDIGTPHSYELAKKHIKEMKEFSKAVFLDRDGVINIDKDYVYKISDFVFKDGIFELLKYLSSKGYKLFIVTNQSGIGRGYYTLDQYYELTHWMILKLKNMDIDIKSVQYCPHTPDDNCSCRKPKSGMIDDIVRFYNIDLKNSWMIGDKMRDIKCGQNANIAHSILIDDNSTEINDKSTISEYIVSNIDEVFNIIR